jgi:hypothetical protein
MNFFKNLFSNRTKEEAAIKPPELPVEKQSIEKEQPHNVNKSPQNTAPPQQQNNSKEEEDFKNELYLSMRRYYSNAGLQAVLNLTNNGITLKEHEAFDGTYREWQDIRSAWDRMGLFYDLWDQTELKKLEKWQVLERYIKDRRAVDALNFKEINVTTEDFMDIRVPVALSKMYRSLDTLPNALYYAEAAYKLRPDLDIVKVELATALHISDNETDRERAHSLMQEVLEKKIKASGDKEVALLNFFIFSEDYIDSSIFAALYLQLGNCDVTTWDTMAEEYYSCPRFRYEHAVFLNNQNDNMRAIAKLDSLANEFPWFKKGVLTYIDSIKTIRKNMNNPSFLEDEMKRMEQYKSMWKN